MIYRNQNITTPIIPSTVRYYTLPGETTLDFKAICCFIATGFFLEDDTYFTNQKAFRPASVYRFDEAGNVSEQKKYFNWHYSPRDISFEQALDEFTHLFEKIVERETTGKKIILPISGGLDSRALAAALQEESKSFSYSYEFEQGSKENFYGELVAKALGIEHQAFVIPKGYLWEVVEDLASINGCYSDFLNPRQMSVWNKMEKRGDLFLLGHGGDLFFDGMGVPDTMTDDEQMNYLVKKLIKSDGLDLGNRLWKAWALEGDFKEYIVSRFKHLLSSITISNANARLRAFKTEFYVSRWTSVNLEIFARQKPISLPFFDDEMCKFICTVPEECLASRKLEIEYLKRKSPALAAIPWQKHYPCNLYNYEKFNRPSFIIKRASIKAKRIFVKSILGKRADTRNWELQFEGVVNRGKLETICWTLD